MAAKLDYFIGQIAEIICFDSNLGLKKAQRYDKLSLRGRSVQTRITKVFSINRSK